MSLAPGRTLLRRYWRAGRIGFVNIMHVIADDERGLRLWQPIGGTYWRAMTADGRTHHDGLIDELGELTLTPLTWQGSGILAFMPPDEPYSVWWFFAADGAFTGWYVNLEDPVRRWDDGEVAGVDTADHALDVVVAPNRSWRWKDEDEFVAKTGHPLYWTAQEAAAIRSRGERLITLVETGQFPFDGTWCDVAPAPSWAPPTTLPHGWDRPRAGAGRPRAAAVGDQGPLGDQRMVPTIGDQIV